MAVDIDTVRAHARFFDHLVDLIPAKFYNGDGDDRVDLMSMKKAARAAAKQEFKAKYKENKLAKLDPDAPATTLEQQKAAAAAGSRPSSSAAPGLHLSGAAPSREELKAKLHQKIEAIQAQRNLTEKKQDKKAAVKDKKEKAQKAKEWRQKTLEDNVKAKAAEEQQQQGGKRKGGPNGDAKPSKAARKDKDKEGAGDGDNDFQFARLQFDDGRPVPGQHKGKKLTKEQLLKQAEAKQAEMAEAKASDEGKVKAVQEAWKTALARAGGEKVLDDPKLLRKSLKKEAKRKEKASNAWQERKQAQADQQASRQKKRTDNLQARTATKIENKKAKREKKLLRAGFEGRKAGFIGADKS